ncbi:MAG: hypothetical protein Q7J85_03740 [Bacillota bacterium]|nr:hypothetical protein [Bacillota bacterium]
MKDRELLETILQKIAGMETNMVTKIEFADIKTELSGVKTEVASMKTELSGVKTEVANVKTELSGVKTEVASVKTELSGVKTEVASVKTELSDVKTDVKFIKDIVIKIENQHGQKLAALFDGYIQTSQKLDRIEVEVAKHDELILKRLK